MINGGERPNVVRAALQVTAQNSLFEFPPDASFHRFYRVNVPLACLSLL